MICRGAILTLVLERMLDPIFKEMPKTIGPTAGNVRQNRTSLWTIALRPLTNLLVSGLSITPICLAKPRPSTMENVLMMTACSHMGLGALSRLSLDLLDPTLGTIHKPTGRTAEDVLPIIHNNSNLLQYHLCVYA